TVLHDRAECGQYVGRGVPPNALVARKQHRITLALRHGHGHDLRSEASAPPGGCGAAMALRRKGVGILAGNCIFTRQRLGRLDHPRDMAEARDGLRSLTPSVESIVELDGAGALSPAHVGGV